MWWWNQGEEQLPSNTDEVKCTFDESNVFNFSLLVLGWMQFAGRDELLAPGLLLFLFNFIKKLLEYFGLFLGLGVGNNVDDDKISLTELGSGWSD